MSPRKLSEIFKSVKMVTKGFPRACAHSLSNLLTALVAEVDDSVSPACSKLDPLCAGAFLSCAYPI